MNKALFETWLMLQRRAIPGVRVALARVEEVGTGHQTLTACIPPNTTTADDLVDMLRLAQRGRRTVVAGTTNHFDARSPGMRLAHPISRSGKTVGAIALELKGNDLEQQRTVTKLLMWGNAWLELLLKQYDSASPHNDTPLEMLLLVLRAEHFQEAAMSTVGVITQHYDVERASFGLCRSKLVQPIALSDCSNFSPRSALAQQLGQAMTEAVEQGRPVNWPVDNDIPDSAHQGLADQQLDGGILSVVLRGIDGNFGVITLEKTSGKRFTASEQDTLVRAAEVLGQILELKQTQEYSIIARTRIRIKRLYSTFVTQHPFAGITGLMAGLTLLTFVLFGNSTYRVGGSAELQGEIQRALIVPFDAYIAAAHVRAGEQVDAGVLLAELDDRELRLELRQLEGDLNEHNKQYRKSLAALDHAEAQILKAQIAQAGARIDLLQQHLERTRLIAPFDAVVVSGDLSRSLGKPVERGEVLFELAPLDSYRVVLDVQDRDIAAVASGQHGALVLAASPTEQLPFKVVNVTSARDNIAELGTFRVEGRLTNILTELRPGMRGIAKIEVGERRRIWIWTHELVDWLRYQLWAWLP